jgi:hypothetical protein
VCTLAVSKLRAWRRCSRRAVSRRSGVGVLVSLCSALLSPTLCEPCLAQANVKQQVAEIELPKMNPIAPLDRDVHVGLFVPPDLKAQNPVAYYVFIPMAKGISWSLASGDYTTIEHITLPEGAGVPDVKVIKVDLATAYAARLRELVHGLFASTTLRSSPQPNAAVDILLSADIHSTWTETLDHRLLGLGVRLTISAVDSAGETLDVIEAFGIAVPTKGYWSTKSRCAGIGAQALSQAFGVLEKKIRGSEALSRRLRQLAEARAQPADLQATAEFDDRDGILPNGRLDAGEQARLVVHVANRGRGMAFGVTVGATANRPQVSISGTGQVGDLAPGEERQVTLPIASTLDLPAGNFGVRIEAADKRGYGARPVLLQLTAGPLTRPGLEIVDVALNDRTGRAHGDGDGRPANGETIEAIVRVRNDGPGEAAGISITAVSPTAGVELLDPGVVLARIAPHEVGEARLLFRLPLTFAAPALSLSFLATDSRGTQVGTASKTETWEVRTKRPAITVTYHLYDGNSVGSRGNRDGQVNNGERIELALLAANHGEIEARDVRIDVESEDPLLIPQPHSLEVGALPANAEAPEQRFVLEVPRGFGSVRPKGEVHLAFTISQHDFPLTREAVALPFRFQRPDLVLEIASPEGIARGVADALSVQTRNQGELAAEGITVDVSSETAGVDLLDEQGSASPSHRFTLGNLAAQVAGPRFRLGLLARQTAPAGEATVRISVSQRDFPAVSKLVRFKVGDPAPTVISAVKPSEPVARVMPTAPATISFVSYTNGQHLLAQTIDLAFEVQSTTEPSEIRLTDNGLLLPLEAARRTVGTNGDLKIYAYSLRVTLQEGENHFEVVALTRDGHPSTRFLSLYRDEEKGKLWVVAIGVSTYSDPTISPLEFPAADAQAVVDYFRDAFGLPASQLFLRTNQQASLREIKSLLGVKLRALAHSLDDTVIIYFAGHGARERVQASASADGLDKYLLPYDASLSELYSTALRTDDISEILQRLQPERIVVLLDSCFSGAGKNTRFVQTTSGERAPLTPDFLDRMVQAGHGRVLITASGPNEAAIEDPELKHGVFTYFLLKALHGAAADADGWIDTDAAYRYLSANVPAATSMQQHPHEVTNSTGRIVIGRTKAHVHPAP